MLSSPWVRLTNNWTHDVSTGLWAVCLLVLWTLSRRQPVFERAGAESLAALGDVSATMFAVLVGALVMIALIRAARLVYWRAETPVDIMPAKRLALIGKHVAFFLVYGGGTWWAWTLLGQAG